MRKLTFKSKEGKEAKEKQVTVHYTNQNLDLLSITCNKRNSHEQSQTF